MNYAPVLHPTTTITYRNHDIRVATRGDQQWLVVPDLAAIFPGIMTAISRDLDEDERWVAVLPDGQKEVISLRGAVLASCLLPAATDKGQPEHAFRVWLYDEAIPAIHAMQPNHASTVSDPKQRRLLDTIKRLDGANTSELTRASQNMRRRDRTAALAALEARGLIVSSLEQTGGRPAIFYRLAPSTPAP